MSWLDWFWGKFKVTSPFAFKTVRKVLSKNRFESQRLPTKEANLAAELAAKEGDILDFIGESPAILKIKKEINNLQRTKLTTLLISGESGTGKELVARAIHFGGVRAKGAFIAVNCATISSEDESILFGRAKGIFSTVSDRKGYFELASGGTLFLDNIDEMPLSLQAKLLQTLENSTFRSVGSYRKKTVDIQVIATTNTDLTAKTFVGKFVSELYFWLVEHTIHLPPLRERREDIPLLVEHFLSKLVVEMNLPKITLNLFAVIPLETYTFLGNVRELRNILEKFLISGKISNLQLPETNSSGFTLEFIKECKKSKSNLSQVRPPRVKITYDVETGGAIEKKELPFILGVISDLSGKPEKPLPPAKKRKFVDVDRDNFNDVIKSAKPRLAYRVANKLADDDSQLNVELKFEQMDDFHPGKVIQQIEPLRKLYQARQKLTDLLTKLDGNDELERLLQEVVNNTKELLQWTLEKHKFVDIERDLDFSFKERIKSWGISAFVGKSEAIRKIFDDIESLQPIKKTNILILGESGTGKELVARAIHFGGVRAKGPFIAVNCAAIPSELTESILFGHVRGAFTGAVNDRQGYFELASGGTLFLDEMGEMPYSLQAKLLRTLENGTFMPVGSYQEKQVDVRVIAATNVNLVTKMLAGEFRNDLYFRLAGYTIQLPSLRERREDLPLLIEHFLSQLAVEMDRPKKTLDSSARELLGIYAFPGNVRELRNILEQAIIISDDNEVIQSQHIRLLNSITTNETTNNSSPVTTNKDQPISLSFPKAQQEILTYIRQQGSITNSECQRHLNVDYHRASYLLKEMKRRGQLVLQGSRRGSYYVFADSQQSEKMVNFQDNQRDFSQ